MKPTYEELLAALKRVTAQNADWEAWRNAIDVIHRAEGKVPYPEHCFHPSKCAGKTDCPRDPTCID